MQLASLSRYLIVSVAAVLLIACDSLLAGPTAAPAPRSTATPVSVSGAPLARLPAPSSAPATTVFPITITPAPDWGGVPERITTTPFPTSALPQQPAPNFAFSFGYGACQITRVLNTFDNTLMQHSLGTPPVTITFALTPDERSAIYQHMRAINLFAYPAAYTIPIPDNVGSIMTAPNPRYEFTLRNDTLLKTLVWEDAITRPTSDEADQLRDLIAFLKTTIESHPEIRRLPRLIESCA